MTLTFRHVLFAFFALGFVCFSVWITRATQRKRLELTFSKRRELVDNVCKKHGITNGNIPTIAQKTILIDEKHRFLYCSVPKVASTTWKKLLVLLNSNGTFQNPSDISDSDINDSNLASKYLKSLSDFKNEDKKKQEILQNYTKIMWVRDPLERLVSAWRSKFTKENRFYSKVFGSYIIGRYRRNATALEINRGFPISLTEFFRYVQEEGKHHSDTHW